MGFFSNLFGGKKREEERLRLERHARERKKRIHEQAMSDPIPYFNVPLPEGYKQREDAEPTPPPTVSNDPSSW